MEEKTDRPATKLEEQVVLLSEVVAQQAFYIESLSLIASALAYNLANDMASRNVSFLTPNWKDDEDAYKQVTELCNKIVEANKANGPSKTNKS